MSSSLNIAHYVQVFSLPSETFIYDLLKYSGDAGFRNVVLTQKRVLEQERPFSPLEVVPSRKLPVRIQRKFLQLDEWTHWIRKYRCELVHAHFGPNGTFIHQKLRTAFPRLPIITSLHGTDLFQKFKDDQVYAEALKELAQDPYCHFTVNSDFMLGAFEDFDLSTGDNVTVLRNTFHDRFSTVKKTKFYKPGDRLKLLNVGRLVGFKGQCYLLEAVALLVKEFQIDVTLTIVGEGHLEPDLKAQAKELGISDQVEFLGAVAHEKLPVIFLAHDIYVQPSIVDPQTDQVETFGIALLEAISCGLYVIGTNAGGIPEVLQHESPYSKIVPQKSARSLASAIHDWLLKNAEFSANTDYAEEITECFSNQTFVRNLKSLYETVLKHAETNS